MRIRANRIARDFRLDPDRTMQDITEALERGREGKPGGVRPEEFSLRDLAEELVTTRDGEPCGYQWTKGLLLQETAIDAVDVTAFANITGQLLVSKVLEGFQREEFTLSRLIPAVSTRLDGEKIPGIERPRDPERDHADALVVNPAQPYPHVGFGEDYIETPSTTKRGLIIPVTKEAIFFDRTNLVLQRASEVGEVLGSNKERRLVDLVIGATNNFKWKGTSYNTFYAAVDSGPWVNHKDDNDLVDWSAIDEAEQLFAEMTDPATGDPILIGGRTVLVTPAKRFTGQRIISATEVRETTNTNTVAVSPNPLSGMGLRLAVSALLYQRLQSELSLDADTAKGYWFYGDPAKAFAYMENWPITVLQSPQNSEAEFNQDVVVRYKASERGAAAVLQPRAWQRHRAASASSSSGT